MSGIKLRNVSTAEGVGALNKIIKDGNKHVFVLVFNETCGPCIATRPEWDKINTKNKKDNVVVAEVNSNILNDNPILHIETISEYPTIKHIHNNSTHPYNGDDRNVASFEKWIQDSVPMYKKQMRDKKSKKSKTIKKGGRKRGRKLKSKKGGKTRRIRGRR